MCYAHAGSALHNTLEKHYNNEFNSLDEAKTFFDVEWGKYKLPNSKIKNLKDNYIKMLINGINLDKHITSTELKIFYPDVVGFLDGVNSRDGEIYDWKSSTRRCENEVEYVNQLKYYSWLYYRKFGKLPTKCSVYYLKYNDDRSFIDYVPMMEDVKEVEKQHYIVISKMEEMKNKMVLPPVCKSCNFFCPYKDLCEKDGDCELCFTLHIKNGFIIVDGIITDQLNTGLNKKFSYELKDAFFIKKRCPWANTTINFWNRSKKLLPLGFLNGVIKTLKDYAQYKGKCLNLKVIDHRKVCNVIVDMPDRLLGSKKLRKYQLDAVNVFLDKKMGMLEMATGSGKTMIAAEIIRRLGTTTLFIVNRKELLLQSKKVMEDVLGIDIGIIGAGFNDVRSVTVATIQTLKQNLGRFKDYLSTIDLVIVDECHSASSLSYTIVGKNVINANYILGITGTAFRSDGNDMAMHGMLGDIIHKLDSKTLIDNGWLVKPDITFIGKLLSSDEIKEKEEKCSTGLINESMKYSVYYDEFIVNNEKRNNLIKYIVGKHCDDKILILVKLVKHGELLEGLIHGSAYLSGSTGKKKRVELFDSFAFGDRNVLISTISIFAEGIDIPSLSLIINCSGNKGDVKSIQVLGRVLRKNEGKTSAKYIDFVDDPWVLKSASFNRRKAFINAGHSVKIVDVNDYIVNVEC